MPPRSQSSDDPETHPGDGSGGPLEAAAFVATALTDLALISRRHGLGTLGYLLDVAHMEADEILRRGRRPGG